MPPGDDTSLELRDVSLSLDGARLFTPLSLTVRAGEAATVMGPSGCGKSSLLAHICGTLAPAFTPAGRVSLAGEPLDGLPPDRRRIGILFQDDLLFPHLSVGENLAFGLTPEIRGHAARREKIEAALDEAGLADMTDRDPATLSGGQRTRVALMRTLLSEPRALLLDEPFSKLDAELRDRIRTFVFEHARANGIPTLLVTHDPDDAAAASGETIELR
ncbi:MAG: ATP-binding cassette domain-containing protein [Rhodospirillaceae bacterium]